MTTQTIVSGAVSTVTELGKNEIWLQGWLSEQPDRLGLGELEVPDAAAEDDDRSFVATDAERCFSVDVQLGGMEASRGFGVLGYEFEIKNTVLCASHLFSVSSHSVW